MIEMSPYFANFDRDMVVDGNSCKPVDSKLPVNVRNEIIEELSSTESI